MNWDLLWIEGHIQIVFLQIVGTDLTEIFCD